MNVLVLGAGGFLGLNTVEALLAAGITPRCGRRKRGNVLMLRRLKVPLVETDLERPDELARAFEGTDVLVHAAAHYPKLSVDRDASLARGLAELDVVLDAAARAQVRRVLFVSSTATVAPGPGGPATEADRFASPPGFGLYHDLKWSLERRLDEERRFELVVACPGACLGPHDWKVGTSAFLVALATGRPFPHPDGLVHLVDARDVGQALVLLAQAAQPPRRVLLAARTERLQGLLERLAPRFGVPPPSAPLSAAEALALADREEARAHREGGRAALSRELADLILHATPLDAGLSRQLGVTYRPLEDTLSAWEAWARGMGILTQHSQEKHA